MSADLTHKSSVKTDLEKNQNRNKSRATVREGAMLGACNDSNFI